MIHRRTTAAVLLAASLGLVASACSDTQDVGSGVNTGVKGKLNELSTTTTVDPAATTTTAPALGLTTTTAKAPVTTVAKTVATTATTAVKATTTTVDRSFQVGINGDKSGKSQFDPNNIAVRANGLITFTNNDSVVRSVFSSEAGFRSPDIPPGGTYVYKAVKVGTFQLKDGTRPYVTATLQVVG